MQEWRIGMVLAKWRHFVMRPVPKQHPARVLIADDEPMLRTLLKQIFEREGYSSLLASNGNEALAVSRSYPGPIDLLFSDVEMPQMSGIELATRVQAERPETRVLLTSGNPSWPTKLPFLPKPFDSKELLIKVKEVLAAKPQLATGDLTRQERTSGNPAVKGLPFVSILAFLGIGALAGVAAWRWFRKPENPAAQQT
jgi:DNA-binding NtrC family response regulator